MDYQNYLFKHHMRQKYKAYQANQMMPNCGYEYGDIGRGMPNYYPRSEALDVTTHLDELEVGEPVSTGARAKTTTPLVQRLNLPVIGPLMEVVTAPPSLTGENCTSYSHSDRESQCSGGGRFSDIDKLAIPEC